MLLKSTCDCILYKFEVDFNGDLFSKKQLRVDLKKINDKHKFLLDKD